MAYDTKGDGFLDQLSFFEKEKICLQTYDENKDGKPDIKVFFNKKEGRKRVEHVKSILSEVGIEPERVEMFNASSTMAWKFPEIASKMVEVAKRLGPIGSRGDAQ